MPITIKGKQYVTVAERVTALHEDNNEGLFIETSIVSEDDHQITVKASIVCSRGKFQGHAQSHKDAGSIEGQSPLEVAETSAVGRALGFAGYGSVESIASAEEILSAGHLVKAAQKAGAKPVEPNAPVCPDCQVRMEYREGVSKNNKPYKGWFCRTMGCKSPPVWVRDRPENLPPDGDEDSFTFE